MINGDGGMKGFQTEESRKRNRSRKEKGIRIREKIIYIFGEGAWAQL